MDPTQFIGISFGSVYSCISILGKDGIHPQAIANEDGDRQIPSYVAFTGHEVLCGTQAKIQALANPKGTIIQFRNILGKRYDDEYVQAQARKYRMNIVASPDDESVPAYKTAVIGEEEDTFETHTVIEVTSKYLAKLKETAESYLSSSIIGCVISIPAHFEDAQKDALIYSAHSAGFKKVYPVHEPVAAVLAFDSLDAEVKVDKQVFVLDLGAHQFNLTHLSCHDGLYTVEESIEIDNLGGNAFDEVLVEIVKQEFKRKYKIDISDNRRAMQKLRIQCEKVKRALSRQDTAPCAVESLYDGLDYNGTILRGRFDMMAEPLYSRCKDAVARILKECKMEASQVDEVILVGGCARIPRFQSVMKSLFPTETQFRVDIDPDEAIAIGCGIQAKILVENNIDFDSIDPNLALADHTSASLGVATTDGTFVPLIPVGTSLPVRREIVFNVMPKQTEAFLAVYEGESKVAKDNKKLAELVLNELEVTAENKQVHVVFIIEEDKVLTVTISEPKSGQSNTVEISP